MNNRNNCISGKPAKKCGLASKERISGKHGQANVSLEITIQNSLRMDDVVNK